jgi:hypothetical protein
MHSVVAADRAAPEILRPGDKSCGNGLECRQPVRTGVATLLDLQESARRGKHRALRAPEVDFPFTHAIEYFYSMP